MTAKNCEILLIDSRKNVMHQMNEQITAENKMLISTLQSIGDGIITCDNSARICFMNRQAEQLTGWTFAQADGLNLEKVYNVRDLRTKYSITPFVLRVLRTGKAESFGNQLVLTKNNGTEILISDSVTPLKQDGINVSGLVIVFKDRTRQAAVDRELLKEQRFESTKIMASGIAHIYNNILTAILGNTSLAMMCLKPDSKIMELLVKTEKACYKARDFNHNLLAFATTNPPLTEKIILADILQPSNFPYICESGSTLNIISSEGLWTLDGDKNQIKTAIGNILTNAVQAMPEGGSVIIRADNIIMDTGNTLLVEPGRYVKVSVTDQGTGIPAIHIDKAFDPFFTTKNRGSGLGLTLCYSIIKRHGGNVIIESTEGKGSTVTLFLPASKPALG
jgi:PAS domain S-box-containing protein